MILDRLANLAAASVRNATLYKEADRFALALDSIGEAVAFLGSDLDIQYVNRFFEQTFGYSSSEIVDQTMTTLVVEGAESQAKRQQIIEHGFKDGRSGEVKRKAKSGEIIDVLLTVAPVKSKDGKTIGRISVSRNITEGNKTVARLNEQSRLAAVGELAAGVVHGINNPLTNILLCSQLMAEEDETGGKSADLEIISSAAKRAARIVQSLLLFARREDPQQEPMSLETVVKQALELKKYDFNLSNIGILFELEHGLPNALIDSHQMSQVIINILSNAE